MKALIVSHILIRLVTTRSPWKLYISDFADAWQGNDLHDTPRVYDKRDTLVVISDTHSAIVKSLLKACSISSTGSSPHHSQPTFPLLSIMSTPTTTFLLPHPPATPVPIPITTDCDTQMPDLFLPPALATNQNVVLPTTPSNPPSFIYSQKDSVLVNPLSTCMTGKQHTQMTVSFNPRE